MPEITPRVQCDFVKDKKRCDKLGIHTLNVLDESGGRVCKVCDDHVKCDVVEQKVTQPNGTEVLERQGISQFFKG